MHDRSRGMSSLRIIQRHVNSFLNISGSSALPGKDCPLHSSYFELKMESHYSRFKDRGEHVISSFQEMFAKSSDSSGKEAMLA